MAVGDKTKYNRRISSEFSDHMQSFFKDPFRSIVTVEPAVNHKNRQQTRKGSVQQMASEGKRITAYAYGEETAISALPEGLIFVGCAVFEDPIRPGVKSAILKMADAGIRTIMVTGDNPAKGAFVARSVGLDAATVITGAEINRFSDRELIDALRKTQVFACTTSEHKPRIVEALKKDQQIIAVIGDGIKGYCSFRPKAFKIPKPIIMNWA